MQPEVRSIVIGNEHAHQEPLMLVTTVVIRHIKNCGNISLSDPNWYTHNESINSHNTARVLIELTCLLQKGIKKEYLDKVLMNRVLSSQVCHPFELFKSCQVRKLGLNEIRHLNGADIPDLTFGVGTLISCLLFMSAEVIIKGGQRQGLLWLLWWRTWWCGRWL